MEDIEQWHFNQNIEIDRLAQLMVFFWREGHNVEQVPEYWDTYNQYLWEQHVSAEHDKFDPPWYSDHRFG